MNVRVKSTALLALYLGACSDAKPQVDAPALTKLVQLEHAVIQGPQELAPLSTLLADGFDEMDAAWHLSTDADSPLKSDPSLLQVSYPALDGNPVLRLQGERGVLYRLLPVQPGHAYAFSVRTRSNGLQAELPFDKAMPWLAELSASGTRETLMARAPSEPLLAKRHLFKTCIGETGWMQQRRVFVTGPETQTLLVVAMLSFSDAAGAGSVDFDDFRLEEVPMRVVWEHHRAEALVDFARGELPFGDWRDRWLVRGYLGAEVRPSILSFPGQSTGFLIDIPRQEPSLMGALGPWPAALQDAEPRQLSQSLWIDGERVEQVQEQVSKHTLEDGWRTWRVDLSPWAGQRVELELRSEGELPGLFGSISITGKSPNPRPKNLILISLDTFRADHMGSYGASGNPTPRMDAFAATGIRCANVTGQAPYTLPGHATMFSGQYPMVHGAQRPSQIFSGSRSPILARILSEAGYVTEAFTGGGLMNADFGFDKGFDRFANIDPLRRRDSAFFQAMLKGDPAAKQRLRRNHKGPTQVTRAMIDRYGTEQLGDWLGAHTESPFFLFVHTYSVHDYDPPDEFLSCRAAGCRVERRDYNEFRLTRKGGWVPQPISDAERDHMRHLYTGTVRQADFLVGKLLARIHELGLDDNTVVAIATDHGEELLERGFQQHGKTLYEELTRLPLLLHVPGQVARTIEEPVMMIDLAPTLLAALGLAPDARMNGRNFLEPMPSKRVLYSEIHDDFVHKYALTTSDGWKAIYAPQDPDVDFPAAHTWELYSRSLDPLDTHDVAQEQPEALARAQVAMQRMIEELSAIAEQQATVGQSALSEQAMDQLRELGYADNLVE